MLRHSRHKGRSEVFEKQPELGACDRHTTNSLSPFLHLSSILPSIYRQRQ